MITGLVAGAADLALEISVVGSFSRLGAVVRRRTAHWGPLPRADGRRIVITGATSGIGLAAARALAGAGADLVLVGRAGPRLDSALAEVLEARDVPGASVRAVPADLSDLGQAVQLAERLAALAPIHALVHNAGALATTYTRAPGGSEQTVTVHLLAPYLLTEHLLGVLQDAAPARVVVTTSGGMYTQRHCLADLEMSPADYRGPVAYARAKRAQVVLVDEWQRRYRRSGVDFFAVHPGWADTPGLRHGMPTFARWLGPALRTPEEGADTLAWLAAGGGQPVPGRVWLDRRPRLEHRAPWTIVPQAAAADQGAALWAWCAERARARTV